MSNKGWIDAINASYNGEQIDPLIEKILVAILSWDADGKSPNWISNELETGTLFTVTISRDDIRAIIMHNNRLGEASK